MRAKYGYHDGHFGNFCCLFGIETNNRSTTRSAIILSTSGGKLSNDNLMRFDGSLDASHFRFPIFWNWFSQFNSTDLFCATCLAVMVALNSDPGTWVAPWMKESTVSDPPAAYWSGPASTVAPVGSGPSFPCLVACFLRLMVSPMMTMVVVDHGMRVDVGWTRVDRVVLK